MQLTKLSEAYTLYDESDVWMTSGNVNKDLNGTISINLNSTLKNNNTQENRWGSLFYTKNSENSISANYNFEGEYKEDFVDYCEKLIAQILTEIKQSII